MTEPWCWPPEAVAKLTDAQILYVRATQAEKVRRATETAPGGTPGGNPLGTRRTPPPKPDAPQPVMDAPPHRETMVGFMVDVLKMKRDAAEADYARQLARWEKAKAEGRLPSWED